MVRLRAKENETHALAAILNAGEPVKKWGGAIKLARAPGKTILKKKLCEHFPGSSGLDTRC